MRRTYGRKDPETFTDLLFQIIGFITLLIVVFFWFLYWTSRSEFWHWLLYVGLSIIVIFVIVMTIAISLSKKDAIREILISTKIKDLGLESEIVNLITAFGKTEKTKGGFEYSGYQIAEHRIRALVENFNSRGVPVTYKEFELLIKQKIDERERDFTLSQVQSNKQNSFDSLNGTGFESLLQRLYEKMGYVVRITGRTGDQGGDLVAIKDTERLLIQAKCYKNVSVGNSAVQEAFAAMSHYECNKSSVVTTSYFTKEAYELAKSTGVKLIEKRDLQEYLKKYLSETWT